MLWVSTQIPVVTAMKVRLGRVFQSFLSSVFFKSQHRFSHKGTSQMGSQPPSKGILHRINRYIASRSGIHYVETTILDANNGIHQALAFDQEFGDLARLKEFEGLCVNLTVTPNGLRLRPITEQIPPSQQRESDSIPQMPADEEACPGETCHRSWQPHALPDDTNSPMRASRVKTLQEMAATVAKLAKDLDLPTCMWIHLP